MNPSDFSFPVMSENYNSLENAQQLAESRNQVIVFPANNELQIDIDNQAQHEHVMANIQELQDLLGITKVTTKPSKTSGHYHLYVTLNREINEGERQLAQAALGDDPVRVKLNYKRFLAGDMKSTRLFENK